MELIIQGRTPDFWADIRGLTCLGCQIELEHAAPYLGERLDHELVAASIYLARRSFHRLTQAAEAMAVTNQTSFAFIVAELTDASYREVALQPPLLDIALTHLHFHILAVSRVLGQTVVPSRTPTGVSILCDEQDVSLIQSLALAVASWRYDRPGLEKTIAVQVGVATDRPTERTSSRVRQNAAIAAHRAAPGQAVYYGSEGRIAESNSDLSAVRPA